MKARPRKGEMIRARVSSKMKREITRIARERGESEAVIMREAIERYIQSGGRGDQK